MKSTHVPHTNLPTAKHSVDDTVAKELLSLNQRLSLRTSVPLGVLVLFFAFIAWPTTPHHWVVTWCVVNWMALILRHLVWRAIPADRMSTQRRLQFAQWLPLLPGLANAGAVFFFPYLSDLGRTIFTLMLAGVTTAGIGSSAGYLPLYLAYLCPIMGSLMLGWTLTPIEGSEQWLGKTMAPMLLMYSLTMVSLAKGSFANFKRSISERLIEAHLNQQLRTALAQAEAANAAKTRFLAAASHDLRQPLHSLSLFFATLRLQITAKNKLELLGHIDQALSSLQSQMNTLLDMSKLDAGMVALEWQNFALTPLLEQLRSAYQPIALQNGIGLHVSCPPELVVSSDREQLARVLRNLLDNAIKYTSHGEVRIDVIDHGERIMVSIKDSGCGIATLHHQQVFEEFFQVDNHERDRERGLGLGLPIVRRLATLLNLDLDLQSTVAVGTTVTIAVPRGSGIAPMTHQATARCFDEQPSMAMCQVLVLDDEAAVRAGMDALLKQMGCEVMLAASIEEALAHAAARTPDLVLADLRLRGKESGITAVTLLRLQHPGLPAIIITGDTAPDRLRQAQAAGLPVLHKPVEANALMRAIASNLDVVAGGS